MSSNKYARSSSGSRRNHTNTNSSSGSHQAVRPKMKKAMDLNKNAYVQDRFPNPLPKHISIMWEDITFCLSKSKLASPQKNIHQSCRLDIGKVQFAMTSDRKEKSINILKDNGLEVNVNNEHQIQVTLKEQIKAIDNELLYIESIFETHVINDLDRIDIDVDSSEEMQLIKQPLEKMKQKSVEVYHCKASNTLFVVGKKTEVKEIFLKKKKSNLHKPAKGAKPFQKDLTLIDSFLLEYLGFEEHLSSSIPGAKMHVVQEPPYCIINGSDGANINVDDELRTFLDKIVRKPLTLPSALVKKLFFEQYPEPNDTFYCFITNRLPKVLGKVLFYISKSDTGECLVNCLNETEAQKVAEMVEKSIVSTKVNVTGWTDEWTFLRSWSERKKLFYTEISSEWIEFCCTTDVYDIFRDLDSSSSIKLPDNQLKFLRLFGKDFLSDIEKQFGIHARVEASELKLTGKCKNLRKIEDFITSKLRNHKNTIPLDVPIKCFENRKDEIDTEMNKSECLWNLNTIQKPVKMLKNFEQLGSWIDLMTDLKVTVGRGFPWHMNLDLHIVMTNQSLYPLEMLQSHVKVPEDFFLRGKNILERIHNKMDVGKYTELLKEMKGCNNFSCVALVVCSDSDNKISVGLDIKQKVKEILAQNVNKNIRNFGINASDRDDAQHLTRQVIEAALEFADATPGQIDEIVICCPTAPTQELPKVYGLLKEKRGFIQAIYSDSGKVLRRTETKIMVIEGRLDELKVDVMVNTTNKQLKLDVGNLSSTILEKAGSLLQEECKQKYPDGLKTGQVAKTNAYKFSSLKYIYHISLPDYNEATFREDVKTYVQKCLCQAERDGCFSIAFPALGVGQLKYPRRETAVAMFDAAEEYSLEVINPVLRSIEFLVNVNDKMTHEAFRDEEYRRSNRCLKEIGLTKPFIKTDFRFLAFKTDQKQPLIKITTLEEFGFPPAYAVEVFIGYVETEEEIYRKRAFDEPPSWNDRWFLHRAESMKKVDDDLRKFIENLFELDDRVTEIVIYTNKDSACNISEEEQVKSVCCVFAKKKKNKKNFLQEVIIVVSDEPTLQLMEQCLKLGGQLAIDWKNSHSQSTELSIELIGKTQESLNRGETVIDNLVKTIKQEITTHLVSRLPKVQVTRDPLDNKNDFEVSDEVTAEINPGIVNFKEQYDLDSWVSKVEKSFRLEVTASSEGKMTVKGDFDCILRFEEYLEKRFPDDPPASYIS